MKRLGTLQISKLAAALVLSACAQKTPSAVELDASGVGNRAPAAAKNSRGPVIRAVLIGETLREGKNAEKQEHAMNVDACRAAGWPIKELSASELERLGTTRIDILYAPDRYFARSTRWKAESARGETQLCQFSFVEEVNESYRDARIAGDTVRDGDDVRWSESPAESAQVYALVHAENLADVSRAAGWSGPENRTISGQPCMAWEFKAALPMRTCMWSGGMAWQLDAAPRTASLDQPSEFITGLPLEQEPLDGMGVRLRLKEFSANHVLTPNEMSPITRKATQ